LHIMYLSKFNVLLNLTLISVLFYAKKCSIELVFKLSM